MGPYIIVSLTLCTLIYQKGAKDTCLNYGVLRPTTTPCLRVVCAQEDTLREPEMFANKNLIVVVAKRCQNSAYANDLYFA